MNIFDCAIALSVDEFNSIAKIISTTKSKKILFVFIGKSDAIFEDKIIALMKVYPFYAYIITDQDNSFHFFGLANQIIIDHSLYLNSSLQKRLREYLPENIDSNEGH